MSTQHDEAVVRAEQALASDDRGHLPLRERVALWNSLGPYRVAGTHLDTIPDGQMRRANLFLLCAERVIAVYASTSPSELLVRHALAAARSRLNYTISWQDCRDIAYKLESQIQWLPEEGEAALPALYSALSASSALSTAMGDCPHLAVEGLTDDDLDRWDSGMYASWIEAGGGPWDECSREQNDRRRSFWLWYIRDAFASVCR